MGIAGDLYALLEGSKCDIPSKFELLMYFIIHGDNELFFQKGSNLHNQKHSSY